MKKSISKPTPEKVDLRNPILYSKRNSMTAGTILKQLTGLHQQVKSNANMKKPSVIKEEEEENEGFSDGSSMKGDNLTPRHKSKKLIINTNTMREATPVLKKGNSAVLKSQVKDKMIMKKISNMAKMTSMRRLSSVNQVAFNKSLANNFELKDLKQIVQNNNEFEDMSEDEDTKLNGRACYLLGRKSRIRKMIRKLVTHSFFDYFIMIIIFISSVTLAIENPLSDPDSQLSRNLRLINM